VKTIHDLNEKFDKEIDIIENKETDFKATQRIEAHSSQLLFMR
jgi:hypothetical protein